MSTLSRTQALRLAHDTGNLKLASALASPSRSPSATRHPKAAEPPARTASVCLTLPWPPSVNHYYRAVNGRQVLSAEGRQYKARVASMALAQTPLAGDVAVSLWFYRPRKCGDLDNVLKATLDALKGVAFGDDKQVQQIHAARYDDKASPRVEVIVSPAGRDGTAEGAVPRA